MLEIWEPIQNNYLNINTIKTPVLDLQDRTITQNDMILLLLHSKKLKKEKIMRKIVILLGIILFMIACEKGNEEVREAKVVVVVYDENGKLQRVFP